MSNLLERASIVLTPTAYNNGEALCVKPDDGSGDFDFSRNSAATTANSQGLVEVVANNLPRINYEGGCGHWLWENQSTNLITYSEDFSQWISSNIDVALNSGTSPDGGNNASKLTGLTNSQSFYITTTTISSYTFSVYVKPINSPFIRIIGGAQRCWFDIENEVAATNTFDNANIESLSNGWYRLSGSSSSSSSKFEVYAHKVDNTTAEFIGSEFLIWGAQVEAGNISSYIPTSGTSVTRNQDVCNNNSIPALSGSHTVYADYKNYSLASGGNDRDWQSASGRVYLIYNYGGGLDVYNGSAFIVDRSTLIPATNFKIAIVTTPTTVKVFINGIDRTKAGALPNTTPITKWSTPPIANISQSLNSLVFFNEALTDEELTELTTI